MTEKTYDKNIITQLKPSFVPNRFVPPGVSTQKTGRKITRLAYLDGEVIEGGFYTENVWFYEGNEDIAVYPHTHDFDEALAFFGSNPEEPIDLCGEIELWLDDEKHILHKSCLIFIPKGLKHCPLIIRRVDRPIFSYSTGANSLYQGERA